MVNNIKFIARVTFIHVITYILCGVFFSVIFDYSALFTTGNISYYMKPVEGFSVAIGPLVQVGRGLLFGIALLLIKDSFIEKKYGWLKLWFITFILGIINTPAPSPLSIEGLVYTKLPLYFHLQIAPEILLQTLLFSYFVAKPHESKFAKELYDEYKEYLIPPVLAAVMFSLSGIVLALILNVDIMAGTKDTGAFIVMLISVLMVFLINVWYFYSEDKFKSFIVFVGYYLVVAVLPTIYNYISNSPFKSLLTLQINLIPVIILTAYDIYINRQNNKKSCKYTMKNVK